MVSEKIRKVTREDVVAIGVDIAASEGLNNTTLQAVADKLGVRRPSLYHHMPGGLAELHDAVTTAIGLNFGAGEADTESADAASVDASAVTALAERIGVGIERAGQAAARYPGVLEYLLTTGRNSQVALAEGQRTVEAILESDLKEQAPAVFALVLMYVTGWAYAVLPDADEAQSAGFDSLADVLRDVGALNSQQLLRDGIHALLNGLEIQYNGKKVP